MYEELIGLLWNQGRYEEAFNYAERARARSFLDQLASGHVDLAAGAPAELLAREGSIQAEINAQRNLLATYKNQAGSSRDASAIASTEDRLSTLESDYSQVLSDIKLKSPETATLVSVDTATLQEVQKLLSPDVTLLEYFVTENRTLAFVISRNTFKAVLLPVSRGDLAGAIRDFRSFASLDNPFPDSLQKLYAWLVAPVRSHLLTHLVGVVPHGILHYLPFAALTDGKTYFGDQFTLFSLPSASSLRFLKTRPLPSKPVVLALGNPLNDAGLPDLRYAEQEVKGIASMFGTRALVGAEATKSAFLSRASQADLIHLATHGQFDLQNPLFSTLYLAKDSASDGRLEVHEIFGLDLRSRTGLVVLSACQTQLGKMTAGDEVVGLARAFLYGGTSSVIASLWNVDDAATGLLMGQFYQHLREGLGKAQALRRAQADVRAKYPNPYYWSGFVLTGDPGQASSGPSWLSRIPDGALGLILMAVCAAGLCLFVIASIGLVFLLRKRPKR